jgi:hypothetical protein
VALHVRSEAELRALATELERAGHRAFLVVESDPPYAGEAMALGIWPTDRRALKPFLSKYALVAQLARVPRVMTSGVGGSTPPERAISLPPAPS